MLSKCAGQAVSMLGIAGLSLALIGCSCYPERLQPVGPVVMTPPPPPLPPDEPPFPTWRR
jgi:hypothetical protein